MHIKLTQALCRNWEFQFQRIFISFRRKNDAYKRENTSFVLIVRETLHSIFANICLQEKGDIITQRIV